MSNNKPKKQINPSYVIHSLQHMPIEKEKELEEDSVKTQKINNNKNSLSNKQYKNDQLVKWKKTE